MMGAPHRRTRFTSDRERRYWIWTLVVVVTIYSTLGLAGTLAGLLGESGLNAATFVLGSLLVLAAAVAFGLTQRAGNTETFVAVGVAAVYVLVFTRLTSPVERSHLIEYGVVAVLTYAALTERRRNGGRVPAPALLAALSAALVGLIDEVIQWFLPNRVFDPIDILFNAGAAVMATVAAAALARARRRPSSKRDTAGPEADAVDRPPGQA